MDGVGAVIMPRQEIPKISLKAVERQRFELDSQRALLQRTLREAPSIEEAMDVFRALQLMLYPSRKKEKSPASAP